MNQNTSGILYGLSAYFLFNLSDAILKYLGDFYSVIQIAFFAKLFACIAFATYLFIKRQSLRTTNFKLQALRSIAYTYNFLCLVYAFQYHSLAEISFFFYLSPFFVAILSKGILKEALGLPRLISIIFGFIGILIILRPGTIAIEPSSFLMISGVLAYCFANILSRKIGKDEPPINFTFYPALLTTLALTPFIIMEPIIPTTTHFSLMFVTGMLGSISVMFISIAYVKTHAATISLLNYTTIIWAALLGYFIFGDVLNDPMTIIGGVVIMLSGAYMIYYESTRKESST